MRDFSGGKCALVEVPIIRLHGRRLSGRLMRLAGVAVALRIGDGGARLAAAADQRQRDAAAQRGAGRAVPGAHPTAVLAGRRCRECSGSCSRRPSARGSTRTAGHALKMQPRHERLDARGLSRMRRNRRGPERGRLAGVGSGLRDPHRHRPRPGLYLTPRPTDHGNCRALQAKLSCSCS